MLVSAVSQLWTCTSASTSYCSKKQCSMLNILSTDFIYMYQIFVQEDISTIHIQCNLNVWTIKRKLNWKILRIHEVYKYFTYETLYISSSYVFTPSIKPIKVFYQFKLFLSRFYKILKCWYHWDLSFFSKANCRFTVGIRSMVFMTEYFALFVVILISYKGKPDKPNL